MNANNIFNVAGMIVTVAMVGVIVQSPESANILRAIGGAFGASLTAARGDAYLPRR
jgi:preprotein translocase subunit SecG